MLNLGRRLMVFMLNMRMVLTALRCSWLAKYSPTMVSSWLRLAVCSLDCFETDLSARRKSMVLMACRLQTKSLICLSTCFSSERKCSSSTSLLLTFGVLLSSLRSVSRSSACLSDMRYPAEFMSGSIRFRMKPLITALRSKAVQAKRLLAIEFLSSSCLLLRMWLGPFSKTFASLM